jgi:hypothetical protein
MVGGWHGSVYVTVFFASPFLVLSVNMAHICWVPLPPPQVCVHVCHIFDTWRVNVFVVPSPMDANWLSVVLLRYHSCTLQFAI